MNWARGFSRIFFVLAAAWVTLCLLAAASNCCSVWATVGGWIALGFLPPLVLYAAAKYVARGFKGAPEQLTAPEGFWCGACKRHCTGPATACEHMRGPFCPECRAFYSTDVCEHPLRAARKALNRGQPPQP